jgi:hypothetical protein
MSEVLDAFVPRGIKQHDIGLQDGRPIPCVRYVGRTHDLNFILLREHRRQSLLEEPYVAYYENAQHCLVCSSSAARRVCGRSVSLQSAPRISGMVLCSGWLATAGIMIRQQLRRWAVAVNFFLRCCGNQPEYAHTAALRHRDCLARGSPRCRFGLRARP